MSDFLEWFGELQNVATVVGTAMAALIAWGLRMWARLAPLWRNQRRVGDYWRAFRETGNLSRSWMASSGASRCLFLRAQNCKFEEPLRPVRISVVNEETTAGMPSVFDAWQDRPADRAYLKLLSEIFTCGDPNTDCGVLVETKDMDPGILKDAYIAGGVAASVVFYIVVTSASDMIYASLNFGNLKKPLPEQDPVEIEAYVKQAKSLFEYRDRVSRKVWAGRAVLSNL